MLRRLYSQRLPNFPRRRTTSTSTTRQDVYNSKQFISHGNVGSSQHELKVSRHQGREGQQPHLHRRRLRSRLGPHYSTHNAAMRIMFYTRTPRAFVIVLRRERGRCYVLVWDFIGPTFFQELILTDPPTKCIYTFQGQTSCATK